LPISSPRREKPKGQIAFPWNILQAATITIVRSGGSRSSSRHPAGEGNPRPEAFYTTMVASGVMCE
jgi:hypothetical protein